MTLKNYGPHAAVYLRVLGWVNLIGLNLAGLLWLWFARNLRRRHNGFRKASIALLVLNAVAGGAVIIAILINSSAVKLQFMFSNRVSLGMPAALLLAGLFVVIHVIPMLWLLAPGTRAAFEHRRERGLCVQCGYDLRAEGDRCPECGMMMPT